MTLEMTNEQWNDFVTKLDTSLTELKNRLEGVEAWMCRRPGDAIPQVLVDQISAAAIASVTPAPEPEEVPGGEHEEPAVPVGE